MSAVYFLLIIIFLLILALGWYLVTLIFELRRELNYMHQLTRNTNSVSERLKILLDSINKNYFRLVHALTHKPVDSQRMEGGKDDH